MMKVKLPAQAKEAARSFTPVGGGVLQRKCACGGTPGPSGECEPCRKKRLQRKLTIGASNDPLEQEADRIADEVSAAQRRPAKSCAPSQIHRFSGHSTGQLDAAPASVDQALAGPGRPLDTALSQEMEQRFGHDFSQVRVHSDLAAEQSAQDVNAHAYTAGRDIVFGAGRFAPTTHEGQRLIAHELTHVVQQRNGINGSDYGSQPLTFLIQRQTKSEDLPETVQKPTPPPLTLLKIFSENRGSFSRFTGMEFQRESHAKGATSQSLQVKEGGIYWTFTFVINRTTGEFFVRQHQNGTQIVNHYRGRLSDESTPSDLGAIPESDGSVKKPPSSEDSVPDSTPPQKPPSQKRDIKRALHVPRPNRQTAGALTPTLIPTATPTSTATSASTSTTTAEPSRVTGDNRGLRIPPGMSVELTFAINFTTQTDSYADESAAATTLLALAMLLRQNPGLTIIIQGNTFAPPGFTAFVLNGRHVPAAQLMLARAGSVRRTLTQMNVTNTMNLRPGRILNDPSGLRISITITNPAAQDQKPATPVKKK
jgi:hypothetical protein